MYEGYIGIHNQEFIEGWAWNRKSPDVPVTLDIYENDTLVSTVTADRFRLDLYSAKLGNGEHGFLFPIPDSLRDGKDHLISVKFGEAAQHLSGSPFILNSKPGKLSDTHQSPKTVSQSKTWATLPNNKSLLEEITSRKIRDLGEVIDTRFSGIYTVISDQEVVDLYLHDEFRLRASDYDEKNADPAYMVRLITGAFKRLESPPFSKNPEFCKEKLTILDIGSGSGSSIVPLLDLCPGSRIIASDLSPEMLLLLKNNLAENHSCANLALLQLNAEDLAFWEHSFDIVIGSSVLHHLFSPGITLEQCKKVLKAGGLAIFLEPFEPGHGLLRDIFDEILSDSRSEFISPRIINLLKTHILFFDVQKGTDKSLSCYRHIEDKWVFTEKYFEELAATCGFAKPVIYNINPSTTPLENKVKRLIILLPGRTDDDILPEWAWNKIRASDAGFAEHKRKSLLFEGCIIMQKEGSEHIPSRSSSEEKNNSLENMDGKTIIFGLSPGASRFETPEYYNSLSLHPSGIQKKNIPETADSGMTDSILAAYYSEKFAETGDGPFFSPDSQEISSGLDSLVKVPEFYLDVGCRNGTRMEGLFRRGINGIGLDIAIPNILTGRLNYPHLKFVHGFAEEIPFPDNFFDVVMVGLKTGNMRNPEKTLAECIRVAKKAIVLSITGQEEGIGFALNPYHGPEIITLLRECHLAVSVYDRSREKISWDEVTKTPSVSPWYFIRAEKTQMTDGLIQAILKGEKKVLEEKKVQGKQKYSARFKNAESNLEEREIGRVFPEYKKTLDFPGPYINRNHRYYSECPANEETLIEIGINGWLRRADALKLYEMAYFSKGDILELGSYHGLSTCILSRANYDSGLKKDFHTLDIDKLYLEITKRNVKTRGLCKRVHFHLSDSGTFIKELTDQNKKFGFIFVDHSHEYEPVLEVCTHLQDLVVQGGFCLFHDYNELNTFDYTTNDFKVFQAVNEGLDSGRFEFYGIFGCTALYRLCR
jgi:ubiquinone/menaquinone biosynthesis C-methylase UbiE